MEENTVETKASTSKCCWPEARERGGEAHVLVRKRSNKSEGIADAAGLHIVHESTKWQLRDLTGQEADTGPSRFTPSTTIFSHGMSSVLMPTSVLLLLQKI